MPSVVVRVCVSGGELTSRKKACLGFLGTLDRLRAGTRKLSLLSETVGMYRVTAVAPPTL